MGRMVLALAAWMAAAAAGLAAQAAPELRFESPESARPAEARLARVSQAQLAAIMRLVGLADPGDPIVVVLAPEDSELARGTPGWIAGFAVAATGRIVLFPARSPRYPHDSLESVLYHEVAHVLIGRAAGGQSLPRWFNEGLATVAERPWHFEDRRQLAWALARGGPVPLRDLDAMFATGPREAAAAYAVGGAFTRHIIDRAGPVAPARILAGRAEGLPFERAFERATGQSLADAERDFRRDLMSWERWVPLLTSPLVLWTLVTLLALYAIVVGRRRRAERRRRWDEDEIAVREQDADLVREPGRAGEPPARGDVH